MPSCNKAPRSSPRKEIAISTPLYPANCSNPPGDCLSSAGFSFLSFSFSFFSFPSPFTTWRGANSLAGGPGSPTERHQDNNLGEDSRAPMFRCRRIGQPGRGNSGTRLWTFGPTTKLQDFFFLLLPSPLGLGASPYPDDFSSSFISVAGRWCGRG